MIVKQESSGKVIVVISFAIALFLNILPFPDFIDAFKPDWVALVLIYWVMAIPNRVGVLTGWFVGLFVDVLYGTLFGIHAMTFALMAYIIQIIYHRLRLFPRWKQAVNVAVVIGINLLLSLVLRGLVEPVKVTGEYWLPLIGAMLVWPWIFIALRDIRRKFLT